MPSEPKRKLAAIMFTDMVGYTALMQKDEPKARELIERHRAHMKPFVEKHGGEVLQYVGDGTLCTFDSAIEAVNAAIEIQKVLELEPEINLRIGIHVGDVVVKDDEVYGDGVNIASRIEPLAAAGGICVSSRVRDDIKNQPGLSLNSLGTKDLKNVDEQIEVFSITTVIEQSSAKPETQKTTSAASKINIKWIAAAAVVTALVIIGLKVDFGTMNVESKKDLNNLSIAVLPFNNMNADAENEFFADGITEDILAQLAKIKSLEVISRTSIMQYKNTNKSLREIGKELGVATILEGSVRRGGNRVRIVAQLIDTETDKHLWAETYDRELDDIFAIQSDVAKKIAAALEASLTPDEELSIYEKPTNNIEAYDLFLKGRLLKEISTSGGGKEKLEEAIDLLEQAVELDPEFIAAYSHLARAHLSMYWVGHGGWDHIDERLSKAKRVIDRMTEIDSEHPGVLLAKGYYYYWGYLNYDKALKYLIPALEKQPNNSDVLAAIGYVYRRQGEWKDAIASMKRAVELDPRDFGKANALAQTYGFNRMWKQADRYYDRAMLLKPGSLTTYSWKIQLLSLPRGGVDESRMVLNTAMENIDPNKLIGLQGGLYYLERNYSEALTIFENDTAKWYGAKALLHLKLGNTKTAYSYYDSMRVKAEDKLTEDPKSFFALIELGLAHAGLGEKDIAIEKGLEAVELLPISKDAFRGTLILDELARIYTNVGEYEKAIDQLEFLLSIPSQISELRLRNDPTWDPLREYSRFRKLVEE